jgi:hypothetical protein
MKETLAGDLMRGVGAIAAFLDWTQRQTNHALQCGQLPAFKIGGIWHARKSTILAYITAQEARTTQSVDKPEAA